MKQLPEKTYQGVYPQKWQNIKAAAASYGIKIETASGKSKSFGVELTWEWRYQAGSLEKPTLRITILESGFMRPVDALNFVDNIIQQAIA